MGVGEKEIGTEKKGTMEEIIDEGYEDDEDEMDIENFLKGDEDEESEESKEEKEEGKSPPARKEEKREPEKPKEEVRKQTKIPDEAVELFMDIQESLKGLAPDKQNEASDLAGKIALGITKQINQIKEEVNNVRYESFIQTDAGAFYLKAREMFPDLSPEQAMKGFEKFKGLQLEGSYANNKKPSPSLDRDGRTVARAWGITEKDMISEKKRYDKLMNTGDPRMMRKAGEIEI